MYASFFFFVVLCFAYCIPPVYIGTLIFGVFFSNISFLIYQKKKKKIYETIISLCLFYGTCCHQFAVLTSLLRALKVMVHWLWLRERSQGDYAADKNSVVF